MATTKLISDELGFERWSLLIDHATPHAHMDGVFWVGLERLPAHLRVLSDASTAWNVRALTLMARAGLIELVELKTEKIGDDGELQDMGDATHAAIRILDEGHRTPNVFASRMQVARQEVRAASEGGIATMERVGNQEVEISDALRKTYSAQGPVWIPVTSCCGGCPQHWKQRRETVRYRPASPLRLQRYAERSMRALERIAFSRAAPNLIVVDVQPGADYAKTCFELMEVLGSALHCHTWALDERFAQCYLSQVESTIGRLTDGNSFIDIIDTSQPSEWLAGEGEVRVVFFNDKNPPTMPDALWISQARLEILVIPTDLPHPRSQGRRFVDTTPHVHAEDLMYRITG